MNNIIGHKISWIDSVDSTNDELARQIKSKKNLHPGHTIVAKQQTFGKGQGKNKWEGEPGKNLTFSFFVQPAFLKADQQFYLNMFVSLGVYDLVKSMYDSPVKIKWPNDIYIEHRKIGGILISHIISGNDILYSIVGIGLNVNQTKFINQLPNPVSMKQITGHNLDISMVLSNLLEQLNHHYNLIMNGEFQECRDAYKSALFGYYKWLRFRYEKDLIVARITGVTDTGILQLQSSDKSRIECDLKEIEFII